MFDAHDPLTRDAAFIVALPFIVVVPFIVVAPETPSVDDNDVAPVTPNVFRIVTASFAVNVDDNAVGINDTNTQRLNRLTDSGKAMMLNFRVRGIRWRQDRSQSYVSSVRFKKKHSSSIGTPGGLLVVDFFFSITMG